MVSTLFDSLWRARGNYCVYLTTISTPNGEKKNQNKFIIKDWLGQVQKGIPKIWEKQFFHSLTDCWRRIFGPMSFFKGSNYLFKSQPSTPFINCLNCMSPQQPNTQASHANMRYQIKSAKRWTFEICLCHQQIRTHNAWFEFQSIERLIQVFAERKMLLFSDFFFCAWPDGFSKIHSKTANHNSDSNSEWREKNQYTHQGWQP